MDGLPEWLPVSCGATKALFHVPVLRVLCQCAECIQLVRSTAKICTMKRLRLTGFRSIACQVMVTMLQAHIVSAL